MNDKMISNNLVVLMEKVVWVMELKEDKVKDYIDIHKKENVWQR